jgi:hypothetical protein
MQDRPRLVPHIIGEQGSATGSVSYRRRTDGLVWNDLDALDMPSSLENLTQHIFSYSGVQSSHIERSLIRFGRGATGDVAWPAAAGRHCMVEPRVAGQGRSHGGRDGIVVLRDHNGRERRGHVLLRDALVAVVARGAAGGRGQVTPRLLLVGHGAGMESSRRRLRYVDRRSEVLGRSGRCRKATSTRPRERVVKREAGGKESR